MTQPGDFIRPDAGAPFKLTSTRHLADSTARTRLHALRHAHASHTVRNGESLHVAGRLLGDRRASTANRYVHLDDATLTRAAERVAVTIQSKLN